MSRFPTDSKFPGCRGYPKEIIVHGMPWEIKFCRNTPEGPDSDLGLCDPEAKILYVKYKQTPRETFMTFIHELLHAIEFEYHVSIGHNIIDKLEEATADIFQQNPEFFIDLVVNLFADKGE